MKKLLILFFILSAGFLLITKFSGVVSAAGQNCLTCPSGYSYQKAASGQWACCSTNKEVGCGGIKAGTAQCTGKEGCDQSTGKCTVGADGGPIYEKVAVDLQSMQENTMPNFKFKGATIGGIIAALLPFAFGIAGLLLLLYLVLGGFELMTSGGEPKKAEGAKGKITSAIIGFVVIFISFWLIQILEIIFGLPNVF